MLHLLMDRESCKRACANTRELGFMQLLWDQMIWNHLHVWLQTALRRQSGFCIIHSLILLQEINISLPTLNSFLRTRFSWESQTGNTSGCSAVCFEGTEMNKTDIYTYRIHRLGRLGGGSGMKLIHKQCGQCRIGTIWECRKGTRTPARA